MPNHTGDEIETTFIPSQRLIDALEGKDDTVLDDEVYHAKEQEAANINNGGFAAQIEYLLASGYTEDEIVQIIEEGE